MSRVTLLGVFWMILNGDLDTRKLLIRTQLAIGLIQICFVSCRARFGLIDVNFNDPERKRTLKASFKFYQNVIASRRIV